MSRSRSSSEGTCSVNPNEDIESSQFRFGHFPSAQGAVAAARASRDQFYDDESYYSNSNDGGGDVHYQEEDRDHFTAYREDLKPAATKHSSSNAPKHVESFSQRMLSRFLNSDRQNLRQPDMGDEGMRNDSRTNISNETTFTAKSQSSMDEPCVASSTDSTFQRVLERGATYVSTRGQWTETLYPRISEVSEYSSEQCPPADLADWRQDSKFSLMDASLASKETAASMISKLTFDDTVGDEAGSIVSRDTRIGDEAGSIVSRDTHASRDPYRDGASRDASSDGASRGWARGAFRSSNVCDAQIQQKMRMGGRLSTPSIPTNRIGESNDDSTSTSSLERPERQADRQRLRSQPYRPRSSRTLRSSITSHDGTTSYIGENHSIEAGPTDVQAQNPNIAREEVERLAQRAAEPPHARLLNLPGRSRYFRSERPGAIPMQGRPYNSGPIRSMHSQLDYPTVMISANQCLGPPELLACTSIDLMPQSNTRSMQGPDVLNRKKVTPKNTWKDSPVPAMFCVCCFCCVGLIVLVVGVTIVVTSKHETPLMSETPLAGSNETWGWFLNDLMSISDKDALLNPKSPQYRAGYWLTQMDKLNIDFDWNQILQRYALVVVYHALTENGANVALNGWLDAGLHECEWGTAIVCGSGGSGLSAQKVVALDLSRLELNGTIPDEIRFLDRLESLQMNNNAIHGTIPPVIGSISNLRQLNLERNAFTGEIPSDIGRMTSLTHIDLSHNFFNDTLDDAFFKLAELRYVDLSFNRLSGRFARFADLTFLSTLDIRMNKFNGTFPARMDILSELKVLNIDYNEISGTLPQHYSFVAKFVEMTASNNLLTGMIPSEVPPELHQQAIDEFLAGDWKLEKLDISDNIFSGMIPSLLNIFPNVKHIDVKNNMFAGPVPTFSRSQLEYLSVASNSLTGTISAFVAESLKHMDYSRNHMSGSLPSELGSLTQLEYLDLGNNPFLNGTLASELGALTNVQYIDISNCGLTGTLPTSLQNLTKLVNLTFAGNGFTGPIPPDFQNLSSLKHLALNNNSLSSAIPTTLGKLAQLERMDLSMNRLVGQIPDELTNLGRLVKLFVDHNLLTGDVPVAFCNMMNSPYTNFKELHIDCEVSCPCCTRQNFGDVDCGNVSRLWHGISFSNNSYL